MTFTAENSTITQIETPLYGSNRVGMAKYNVLRNNSGTSNVAVAVDTASRWLGYKNYELKDHLGNVRVVLGDKKTRTETNAFAPEVVSYSNYYPFGMQMYADTWQSPLYRYGYNGKEKDGELHGEGNSYDYSNPVNFYNLPQLTKPLLSMTVWTARVSLLKN